MLRETGRTRKSRKYLVRVLYEYRILIRTDPAVPYFHIVRVLTDP